MEKNKTLGSIKMEIKKEIKILNLEKEINGEKPNIDDNSKNKHYCNTQQEIIKS